MAQSGSKPLVRRTTLRILVAVLIAAMGITLAAITPEQLISSRTTDCEDSLQSLIDSADPGAAVEVPGGCVYREKVAIDKPLTLTARSPGTEIRGSDMWTEWEKSTSYWASQDTVPTFYAHGECRSDTSHCIWPEQVFFDDEPLQQVASDPQSGQFAVNSSRKVLLADNPVGHAIEVTTRTGWITGQSDNVTIQGFTMKHAANDAQSGAIDNNGRSHWAIQDNTLSDAHGHVVSFDGGTDLELLRNDVSRGGQLGIGIASADDALVQDNTIHHNNTEDFDSGWEAGGMKVASTKTLTVDGNKVYYNRGPGLWCDIDCTDVVYSNNRVDHNEGAGIFFEISSGAKIFGNVVWKNGWNFTDWGWGAGVLSSSSQDVEIYDNVLAWNADGISVISQDRGEASWNTVKDVYVHDNTILAKDYPADEYHNLAMAWLQDWAGVMFDLASNNQGANNEYWYPLPESSVTRFAWDDGGKNHLADFNATPGEESGRYLTNVEMVYVLLRAGIPPSFD